MRTLNSHTHTLNPNPLIHTCLTLYFAHTTNDLLFIQNLQRTYTCSTVLGEDNLNLQRSIYIYIYHSTQYNVTEVWEEWQNYNKYREKYQDNHFLKQEHDSSMNFLGQIILKAQPKHAPIALEVIADRRLLQCFYTSPDRLHIIDTEGPTSFIQERLLFLGGMPSSFPVLIPLLR